MAPGDPTAAATPGTLEGWRFRLLGLTLLALLGGHAAPGGTPLQDVLLGLLGLLFVIALVWVLAGRRVPWPAAVLLALPVLAAPVGAGASWSAAAGSWLHLPLLAAATWVLAHRVAAARRVDGDVVAGSILVLLIGAIAFASAYAGIERALPGAFAFAGDPEGQRRPFGQFLYFSFVTVTTLGYGDVTPVHPTAWALTSLEAVLGILYPAVVVARMVGLATAGGLRPPEAREATGEGRQGPGRYRILALVLVLTLVATAVVEESPAGRAGLGLLLLFQVLGALQAIGPGRLTRGLAVLSAAVALTGRVWPGGEASATAAGLFGQVVFFGVAIVALIRWLAHERHVTREVMYAALAVYLLLGFALGAGFAVMDTLHPGAVAFPVGGPASDLVYVYFAFMTLTTTGYGDVTPGIPLAEYLASLGALVGVFYPAVLLARLVSLYGEAPRLAAPEVPESRGGG